MTAHRRLAAARSGVVSVMLGAALFRAAQNAAQTTEGLLGRQSLHLSPGAIGGYLSLSTAASAAMTILVARRLPRRLVRSGAAGGAVLLGLSLLAFAEASTTVGFAAANLLLGAGGGLALPSLATAAGAPGPNRSRRLAAYSVVLSASLALGPLIESAVLRAAQGSLRAPFGLFAGLAALAVVVVMVGHSRATPSSRRLLPGVLSARGRSGGPGLDPSPGDEVAARGASTDGRPLRLGRLLALPGWSLAASIQILYVLPFLAFTGFGGLLARGEYHETAVDVQWGFTVFFASSMAARLSLVLRPADAREGLVIALCAPLTAVGVLLLAGGRGQGVFLTGAAVLGLAHGLTFPLALSLVARSVDHDQLPGANAVMLSLSNGVAVVGPSLLGALATTAGYRMMMLSLLVPVALCSVWLGRSLYRYRTAEAYL
ncbi:MAG: MFS transporter [Acidimicrobiales bacterium]